MGHGVSLRRQFHKPVVEAALRKSANQPVKCERLINVQGWYSNLEFAEPLRLVPLFIYLFETPLLVPGPSR